MAKNMIDELMGYRVKVMKDGKDVVNVPGILALPAALVAPKAGIIGMIAAPLLGCSVHLEREDGREVDVGKVVRETADTVVDTAATVVKTVKEEIEKTWDEMSADDPEECPVGEENEEETKAENGEEASDPADEAEEVPVIRVNPDDSEEA